MIEKVAKAIWDSRNYDITWRSKNCEVRPYVDIAIAAIKAMRKPTEKMLKTEGVYNNCYMRGGHKEGYQLMIDAIINE